METESTYPNPPDYYKDFKSPDFHLDPPKPIEGEYWNNGVIRTVKTPITDYVDRVYPFLYDPKSLDVEKDTKAIIMKKLLRRLIKAYIMLIRKSDTVSQDDIQPFIQEIECVSMNIVRLLNKMREYQFRENVIRSLKYQIEEKEKKLKEIDTKVGEAKELMKECMNTFSKQDSQSPVLSTLHADLGSLLAGDYKYTQMEMEEKEKVAEAVEEELVIPEPEGTPMQGDFIFITNSNDVNDQLSAFSFETDITGIGISLVS